MTDNSLEQAISSLRRLLGQPDGAAYIETQARRGYRFAAKVRRAERREPLEALDALLAPHRAWIEGRASLETLERSQIVHARQLFERVVQQVPDQASAHVGLAGEQRGQLYARECCANAWYAIGAVRLRQGDRGGAGRLRRGDCAGAAPSYGTRRHGGPDRRGRQDDAARIVDEALTSAGEGSALWLLPLEPLLQVDGSPRWTPALGRLSMRSA